MKMNFFTGKDILGVPGLKEQSRIGTSATHSLCVFIFLAAVLLWYFDTQTGTFSL